MTVTPESNLALIQQLQDLVSSAAEPPSGPEFSYPVVDQAVSSSMWSWITLGMGSGILDAGGQPYWLRNLDNASNTAMLTVSNTTGTANATLRGFFHQMSQDIPISLPMPASGTVTWHVCLTFDPAKESDANGPISVQTYAGTPPTTSGRHHLVLWTVRRSANQLLTDAKVTQVRPKIAPSLTLDGKEQLDLVPPETALWGTRVHLTHGVDAGSEYIADGASPETGGPTRWDLIGGEWKNLTLHGTISAYGSLTPRYRFANGAVELRGAVRRTNGSAFTPDGWTTIGWIAGLDMADVNIAVPGSGSRIARLGTGQGDSARDNIRAWIGVSGMSWIALDNVRIPLG